ncbi:endonuclease/exonuclease/phosphatase family protein [Litorivivens sp.]|uniref:endonuclease/exonuclease/phosphatase family protein n=1 Tax=Litorivivens sp. TaxID=2020868 RepID=UPI00356AC567
MSTYRILTLNIHKGFSAGNRAFTLEGIRDCLRQSGANVVFLQEVVGDNTKNRRRIPGWPEGNQMEYLADSVWDHFAYGQNAIYQHGHHGNAILSEIPFNESRNIDISCYSFSQRGLLHGHTQEGIHLLCVHLGLFERERRRQVSQLIDYIGDTIPADDALILAGDFNDWRGKAHAQIEKSLGLTETELAQRGALAKTFPAIHPVLAMDRIYQRGFDVVTSRVLSGKPWKHMSDHCALLSELRRS